jgi:hypothetical protein
MASLLETAIAAHGGLAAWSTFERLEAHLSITGVIWDFKQRPGLLTGVKFDLATKKQRVVISPFSGPDRRSVWVPERQVLETLDGAAVETREDPLPRMVALAYDAPWDAFDVAYFASYALWTYLNSPFLYTQPGFETVELEPWKEDGETWRRLKVTFPRNVASHAREQITYFGPDGLMRRHDYTVDILRGATGANYPSAYREFQGIQVPTARHIYAYDANGQKVAQPLLVEIAIDKVAFS